MVKQGLDLLLLLWLFSFYPPARMQAILSLKLQTPGGGLRHLPNLCLSHLSSPSPCGQDIPNFIPLPTIFRVFSISRVPMLPSAQSLPLNWLILFTSIHFQRKLRAVAINGKSPVLSMKSGFEVLVTPILTVIITCLATSESECLLMYNLEFQCRLC